MPKIFSRWFFWAPSSLQFIFFLRNRYSPKPSGRRYQLNRNPAIGLSSRTNTREFTIASFPLET